MSTPSAPPEPQQGDLPGALGDTSAERAGDTVDETVGVAAARAPSAGVSDAPANAAQGPTHGPRARAAALQLGALLIGAVALNLLLGQWLVRTLGLPLALEHVGTVAAAILLGPVAGGLTGAATIALQAALFGDGALLLAMVPAIWIGWVAGRLAPSRESPGLLSTAVAALAAVVGAALISLLLQAIPAGGAGYWSAFIDGLRAALRAGATAQGALSLLLAPLLAFAAGALLARLLQGRLPASLSDEAAAGPPAAMEGLAAVGRVLLRWIVVMVLAWALLPALGRPLFALFFLPVIAAAWNRGRAGDLTAPLLAVALGAAGGLLLVAPPLGSGPLLATDWLWLLLYLGVALYLVFVTQMLHRRSADLAATAAAQRQASARLQAVTTGVDEALFLIAPDGAVTLVNPRLEQLLAQRADALTGQPLEAADALISRVFADPAQFTHFVSETLAEPTGDASAILEQEWPVARRLAIRTLPVQGSEEYFGRLYLLRDRTLEHETEQLYAGVSSVADENLRAPAARVVSLATRLLEGAGGDLSDVQTRLLTTLRANAERQIALIDAMSEAARLESDQMRLSVAPVDLHALLHNTATAMRPLLQQTHQTLTVDVPADLPTIEGDADRLAQALTNLISNAHRFNQAGGWVRVEARMRGKRVRVVVSDGGLGIARADQQRIFARFARVENDQTRSLTGSGLGLAAVAQIVRLHGGEVEVQSELGEGSTFALLLPLTQLKVVADSAPVLEDDVAEPAAMKPVADDPADGADAAPIETPADEAPADEAQPASDALVAEADVDGADAQLPDAPAKQEADATAVDMAAPTTSVHADVVELPASEPVVMEPEGGTEQDAVVEPTASVDTPVVTEPVAPVEIGAASEAEPAGESEPEEGPEPAAELADDHLPANGTGRSDVPEAEAVAEPEPTAVQPDQAPPEQGAAGTEETAETVHAAAELTGAEGAPAEAALDTRVPEEPAPAEDEIAPATADQAATAHTHSTVDESSGDEAPVPFLAPFAGEDERPAAPAPTATAVDPLEPDEPAEPAEPDLASKAHDGAEPPRDDEADAEPHAAGGPEAIDASDGADITDAADAATPDAGAPVAIAYDPLEDAPVLADDEPPPADEPPPLAAFDPLEEEDPFDDPRSTGTPP